ncbi:ROK family protein, partial [Streptomyces sp. SID3343]|uniref:ROK family protein n=1 Tax=Streptomyces sp. SID3343 TaxID=2690260 RepID=UPI00137035AE
AAPGADPEEPGPDLREITRRAQAGDAEAATVITNAAVVLGRTLAGLVCALDPAVLVVGGGVAGIGPRFIDPLTTALRAEVLAPLREIPVLAAALGLDAPLVGAALLPEDLTTPDDPTTPDGPNGLHHASAA